MSPGPWSKHEGACCTAQVAPATSAKTWPSAPAWPLVGHLPKLARAGFVELLRSSWRDCGDRFELRLGPASLKFVVHPDDVEAMLLTRRERYLKGAAYEQFRRLVGEGLVTSEGELWRTQRRLIQPSFTRDTLTKLGAGMVAQTDAMLDRWHNPGLDAARSSARIGRGEPFDVHAELMRLTLEIIGEALFGLAFGADRAAVSTAAFTDAMEVIAGRITQIAVPPRWLPTPGNRRLEHAIADLDRVVAAIIDTRRKSGDDAKDDLLGALLRARDADGQPIPEQQLRDEVITMFLAGHETTAVALTWALWLLSQHPEVLERCVAEVDAVLGDRPPTAADLPALAYLGQTFHESMRVIPPVWSGARDCVTADELGGLPVEPGDRVINVILLTHMHPEFWDAPARFDPDRFAPAAAAKRHKFAYMPFSEGPRKCVGIHFATMEAQLVLARLLQRGRFEVLAGFEPVMDYQLTTRPKAGLLGRWVGR
jgi:cytochrome P450